MGHHKCGCASCTAVDALMDPSAALPPAELAANPLNVTSSYVAMQHRFTQFIDELRGLVLNDCLRIATIALDDNGQGEISIAVPCAGVAAWNHGADAMTVTSSPPQEAAPSTGIGVQTIAAGGWAAWPATGTFCTVYGTAGELVTIALYEKPIPPGGSGGGSSSASGPSIIPADNIANPATAIPEEASFGLSWDPVGAQWVRNKAATPADNLPNPTLIPEVAALPHVWQGAQWMRMLAGANINGNYGGTLQTLAMGARMDAAQGLVPAMGNQGDWAGLGSQGGVTQTAQWPATPAHTTAAANTAVVRAYAAVAGQRHRLHLLGVSWSGAAATVGLLTVTDGATTILAVDVPLAMNTPHWIPLPEGGIWGSVNTAMTITLSAGGAGAIGKLNTAKITAA